MPGCVSTLLEQQDEARRDFMFLRAFRSAVNGAEGKIGWLVIAAAVGGVIWLVNLGLSTWKGLQVVLRENP